MDGDTHVLALRNEIPTDETVVNQNRLNSTVLTSVMTKHFK